MKRLVGVTLLPLLASCFDNLSQKVGPPSDISTTIDPVAFDAVYVVNGDGASVSVINAETNTVAGTITLGGLAYPHHVAVSPDRTQIGISVPGFDMSQGETGHAAHASHPGKVLILDALTGALDIVKTTDAASHNVVFSPDGNVWTSQNTMPGSTLVLNKQSLAVSDAISVGMTPADTTMTKDGSIAYVANSGASSISVIDVAARSVKATIQVGAGPVSAEPGPNGMVYVDNESDQSISVIDSASLSVVKTLQLGFTPGSIAVASNGELWVPSPARGGVELRDTTGNVVRFVPTGAGTHAVAFSADEKRAYVSNQVANTVSVIDRSSFASIATIAVGAAPNGLAWRSK